MADIIYTYKNQVYANITNKCDCACTFCIRSGKDHIEGDGTLWHKVDPTLEEIKAAIKGRRKRNRDKLSRFENASVRWKTKVY